MIDEETGLYCLGVRFYDPSLGRFLQEDPVLGSLSEPLTLNKYVYCANDPINRMDSNGMKHTGYLAILQLCDERTFRQLCKDHSTGSITFVSAPEYCPFDWFFIGLGVGLPVIGDTVCDVYFIIKDIMANDNDALLVDFGLALIPFISTGHVKAANRVMNAMESSADAGKGVRRTAGSVSELENILHSNAAKKRVAVIGETQARVDKYAAKYGGETMPNLPPGNRMAQNRAWINFKMDEGYVIVDVGLDLDPSKALRGKYYAMELHEILVSRKYQRYYPVPGGL